MNVVIDWDELYTKAMEATTHSYAPYSKLQVGAAAITTDGRILQGCNVENASYGLGACAEVGLTGAMHMSGGGRLLALVATSGTGEILTPCGRCRQILMEQGGPDLLVQGVRGPRPMRELLPDWFGPEDLPT